MRQVRANRQRVRPNFLIRRLPDRFSPLPGPKSTIEGGHSSHQFRNILTRDIDASPFACFVRVGTNEAAAKNDRALILPQDPHRHRRQDDTCPNGRWQQKEMHWEHDTAFQATFAERGEVHCRLSGSIGIYLLTHLSDARPNLHQAQSRDLGMCALWWAGDPLGHCDGGLGRNAVRGGDPWENWSVPFPRKAGSEKGPVFLRR